MAVGVAVGTVAVPEVLVVVVVVWAEAVETNRRAMAPISILSFTMARGYVYVTCGCVRVGLCMYKRE